MKKIMRNWVIVFILSIIFSFGEVFSATVFIDKIMMSNGDSAISDKRDIWTFRDTDKEILLYANVGIVQPNAKKYIFKYICIDRKGHVISKGVINKDISDFSDYSFGSNVKTVNLVIKLDPRAGALVEGKTKQFEKDNDYFIKLYFGNKLIGISEFLYI